MMPTFLQPNDQIRIVSPSGSINPDLIDGAIKALTSWGLMVSEGDFARSEYGRFAGSKEQRIADLQAALDNPDVKAVLCSRGGYGIAQIIDKLDFTQFQKLPKWLIGFSDVTILHNVITNLDIASIHGIMAKHLTELPADSDPVVRLREMLFGKLPSYSVPAHKLNRTGLASGRLIGGNLSVLMGLRGSRYDLPYAGNILFIEDIAEKPYHIDRMMQNLRFSGVLEQISGLVVGHFSDCDEDTQMHQTIAEIISGAVQDYSYPVCFDVHAGHVDYNLPLIMGAEIQLVVDVETVQLTF
jgi:muramoyltetrapeptide carboxypeptidase